MTPIEVYNDIYVKRDDLCFEYPAPPFSKCRGLLMHLAKLKKQGYKYIGYTETSISMAGWGVAWACQELGLTAIIFDPQYKDTPEVLKYHRKQWKKFNPIILPIKAGMAAVNINICKQWLKQDYPTNSIMLPLGLPFEETIEATAIETNITLKKYKTKKFPTIVTCVGSGTIVAGILKGATYDNISRQLYGVMTRSGDVKIKKNKILSKAGIIDGELFKPEIELILINPGWEYTQKSLVSCPFPCHSYYDLKAWEWLIKNRDKLIEPILFWNIGH